MPPPPAVHPEAPHRTPQQLFDDMFEQAAVGMAHSALDGRWLRVNRRLCEITGYTREELFARTWQDITYPDDLAEDLSYVAALHAGEIPHYSMNKRYVHKDGSVIWVNIMISLVRNADGAPAYHVCIVDDITRRVREESDRVGQLAQERATNRELRALQAVTDAAIAHLSPAALLPELVGTIREALELDDAAILLLDRAGENLCMAAVRGVEEEAAETVLVPLGVGFAGRVAALRAPLVVDDVASIEVVTPLLRERLHSIAGVPLLLGERLLGVLHVGCVAPRHFGGDDVRLLERVAALAAQAIERADLYEAERQARAELGATFDAMTDAVLVYDAVGRVMHSNAAGKAYFARTASLLDPEGRLPAHTRVRALRLRDETGDELPEALWPVTRLLRGETLHSEDAPIVHVSTTNGDAAFAVSGSPLRGTGGEITGAVAVLRDVTDQRRLEREAAARTAELAAVVETMPDAAALFGEGGQVLLVNAAFRRLFALDGRADFFTLPIDERRRLLEVRDSEGRPLPPERSPLERVLRHGETIMGASAIDIQTRTPDGRMVDLAVVGSPVRDADGAVTGAVLLYRDVTEHRRLERRTRRALGALLQMAEALVAPTNAHGPSDAVGGGAAPTARRLAQLARDVLGVDRVSMHALDPVTQVPVPLAVAGLSPEQEREWFAGWPDAKALRETPVLNEVANCAAGEVRVIDLTRPPYDYLPALFSITQLALGPMYAGEQLVGVLAMDHGGGVSHTYTKDDLDLVGAVAGLAAVVIERERLLGEREQARAEALALEAANKQMDGFLGIAGHELRTPLTTIVLNLQMLERRLHAWVRKRPGDAAPQLTSLLDLVRRTNGAIARQQRLVNDLLDVSRIHAGKLELRVQEVDLGQLCRAAVEEQWLANLARQIQLDVPDAAIWVHADPDRISQVVTNYLANALKYSSADRPVVLRLLSTDDAVRVEVRDEGPGRAPSQWSLVWERFYRSPDITANGSAIGLGLGLHISREIVERHGGQVGVESKLGAGSTFWFTLPIASNG
jgi:PAS domain S-box-containing protein